MVYDSSIHVPDIRQDVPATRTDHRLCVVPERFETQPTSLLFHRVCQGLSCQVVGCE